MNLTREQIEAHLAERNPFATRSVRPGAITYVFANGTGLNDLVDRLRHANWTGEIIGPHGSGKSTLLQSLLPQLTAAGRQVRAFTLHRGESRLPVAGTDLKNWDSNTQLVIDGYEQLGGWTRTLISRICRQQGCGLILTSHEPMGFPRLYETGSTLPMVQHLVRDLQRYSGPRVTDADVTRSFERQHGNVREVFFELYDLFEQRRPVG